jgi:hypothetical protein
MGRNELVEEKRMKKIDRLFVGSAVVFSRRPLGSWLSEDQPYVVELNSGETVDLRNAATGGGTYDRAADIDYSEFRVLGAG